jgi:hypothetical protein
MMSGNVYLGYVRQSFERGRFLPREFPSCPLRAFQLGEPDFRPNW